MEMEKRVNNKFSSLNPTCMKENNMNCVNMFDTSFRCRKDLKDGFKSAIKLKRNFK